MQGLGLIAAGESAIPVVGPILAGITGLLGALFGGDGGSVKQLNDAVKQVETQVVNGLKTIGLAIQLIFGAGIIGFIRRVWSALGHLAELIHDALDKIAKIVAYIRRIHDYLFNRFIGPVLNAIQHVRQMLVIFRLFHVRFAQQLDATLANIEYKIASQFNFIWQKMNELLSWAQLITGADGLFNPSVLWGSLARDIAILRGVTGLGPAQPLLDADATAQSLDRGLFSAAAVAGRESTWVHNQLPDVFSVRLDLVRAKLSAIDLGM